MDERARLARLAGLTQREVDCVDEQVLAGWARDGISEAETIWRLRRVRRLRRQLGFDYEAIEVMVRLIDRLERLEARDTTGTLTVTVLSN